MASYRNRYLTANEFTSYCSNVNIKLSAFNRELELYEKSGILFPVARITQPKEYIQKRRQFDQQSDTYGEVIPDWDELERVIYLHSPLDYRDNTQLWHCFDREFSLNNKYLHQPSNEKFKSWASYSVDVQSSSEEPISVKSAKHFYHKWQVHQIFAIRKMYPIFAKHNWLLQNLKDDVKDKTVHYLPDKDSGVASLFGKVKYFDALSFYIELYKNEHRRTFAPIPENNGVKQLSDQQFDQYQKNLITHAKSTQNKYSITDDEILLFLIYLLELHDEYQGKEKIKLANDLEDDILFLIRFLVGVTGQSVIEIENEIGKHTNFWIKKKYRHIDKALEIYDYSQDTFERLMIDYNSIVPNLHISATDIEELLDFFETKGLFIIPYAIFDIDETINNLKGFRSALLYNGLSSLTTGLECFLREIAIIANNNSVASIRIDTLHPIISTMFQWGNAFNQEHERRKNAYQDDALSYISDVNNDPNLDDVIKMFLIAYRARNLVAHNYTLEQDLGNRLYGIIYTATIRALLYSWAYAKNRRWI